MQYDPCNNNNNYHQTYLAYQTPRCDHPKNALKLHKFHVQDGFAYFAIKIMGNRYRYACIIFTLQMFSHSDEKSPLWGQVPTEAIWY